MRVKEMGGGGATTTGRSRARAGASLSEGPFKPECMLRCQVSSEGGRKEGGRGRRKGRLNVVSGAGLNYSPRGGERPGHASEAQQTPGTIPPTAPWRARRANPKKTFYGAARRGGKVPEA